MIPPLTISLFRKPMHAFRFFGTIGYFLGVSLGIGLAYFTHLPIWLVILCSIIGAGVLFGLTYLYKLITGRKDLVYYQHEIAILISCTLVLYLLNQPILKYLDITLMGIGVFLVFGRIGCFSVGCCHGKPHKVGITYSQAHMEEGFPSYLVGIKIFPIQLVESISVFVIVVIGTFSIIKGYMPGTALLVYTVLYGLIRFVLEFYRGDVERPYWKGFSEAQWTTLAIFVVSAVLSLYKVIPAYDWHLWTVSVLAVWMIVTAMLKKFRSVAVDKIKSPRHIAEIADGIAMLDNHIPVEGEVLVVSTSENVNMSRAEIWRNDQVDFYYTVSFGKDLESSKESMMTLKTARIIGKLVQSLRHSKNSFEVHEVQSGIFRLVFSELQNSRENQMVPSVFS